MPLSRSQRKAQWVAQCVADGVNFGVEPAARNANGLRAAGLAHSCRGLVRPAARRVQYHLLGSPQETEFIAR